MREGTRDTRLLDTSEWMCCEVFGVLTEDVFAVIDEEIEIGQDHPDAGDGTDASNRRWWMLRSGEGMGC